MKKFTRTIRVWRGTKHGEGEYQEFALELDPGMVVLDAIHKIQEEQDPNLAVRWNCKAGKCGSCAAEVNGKPVLLCMTRVEDASPKPIQVDPMKSFPVVKDLVSDVSWNYEQNKKIKPFTPAAHMQKPGAKWKMQQRDIDRVQEFRKCIECFLCQDVCHVIRDHDKKDEFYGPRFFVRAASLDMHPLDTEDRIADLHQKGGLGLCNITRCCTTVCPEEIQITDNAIIPLKERIVDRFYDPLKILWRQLFRRTPNKN